MKVLKVQFKCTKTTEGGGAKNCHLEATPSPQPEGANASWTHEAAPAATVDVKITNPAAFGLLVQGETYTAEFRKED